MGFRYLRIISFIFIGLFLCVSSCHAQKTANERHIEVSLRMIGHEVLLSLADSTSRVLPIKKEHDRYRIPFESEFEFEPEELVLIVDRIVKDMRLAKSYIMEVEECETGEIVYSFEMDDLEQSDIIPCKGRVRVQPKACYSLLFTLMETRFADTALLKVTPDSLKGSIFENNQVKYSLIVAMFVLLATVLYFQWKRRNSTMSDSNLIPIGEYHFDKRNTELLVNDQKIELTNKEADLLLLLHESVNTTVEREVLLNLVWGDEGDYVGRTLDVFISKLRKKLEADSSVKIVNIRGVGYKLVSDI